MQLSRSAFALSHAAAALMAFVSALGAFAAFPYSRETASWAAQGVGQDLVNLFVVVPVLLVSAEATRRGSRRAHAIWVGALAYSLYSYVLYAFFLHFGPLFLIYVAVLGLAGFAFGSAASSLARRVPAAWPHSPLTPWVGTYLVVVGSGFAFLWLADIVPAVVAGRDPVSLADTGFWVNPIHVLDLAFVLPAMIATGVLVFRRQPLGMRFAPVLATFSALMGLAIVAMMIVMARRGLPSEAAVAWGMAVVTAVSLAMVTLLWSEVRTADSREVLRPVNHGP
jgi:hypothetical protein